MKAYIATFVNDKEEETPKTIGASSIKAAAAKAAKVEEEDKCECIRLLLTQDVIL